MMMTRTYPTECQFANQQGNKTWINYYYSKVCIYQLAILNAF